MLVFIVNHKKKQTKPAFSVYYDLASYANFKPLFLTAIVVVVIGPLAPMFAANVARNATCIAAAVVHELRSKRTLTCELAATGTSTWYAKTDALAASAFNNVSTAPAVPLVPRDNSPAMLPATNWKLYALSGDEIPVLIITAFAFFVKSSPTLTTRLLSPCTFVTPAILISPKFNLCGVLQYANIYANWEKIGCCSVTLQS
jgi:hypothetical protein